MGENVSYYSLFPYLNWNELFLKIYPKNIYSAFTDSVAMVHVTIQQMLNYPLFSRLYFDYLSFDKV